MSLKYRNFFIFIKKNFLVKSEMTDLGQMTFFIGMETQQKQNEICVWQQKYAKEVHRKFNMEDCKPSASPMK